MRAMTKQIKEQSQGLGTWLFRGLAIYFLWNIYQDVAKIPLINHRLDAQDKVNDRQDEDIKNLRGAIFVPSWDSESYRQKRQESLKEKKDTKFLLEYTDQNIADARRQLGIGDCTNNN